MAVNLSALAGAGQQFLDNDGNPLSGGKLWSYEAGTTTPQTTYTDAAGAVAHANPIILDASGRVAIGEIWLTAGNNYKFILTTSSDVLLATWDNITGINGTGITSNAVTVVYDPEGTGAVATTVQAKLRETVSVKDFGAVGDGVTDDTAAIILAITNSENVTGNNGTYRVKGEHSITKTGDFKLSDISLVCSDTDDEEFGLILTADLIKFSSVSFNGMLDTKYSGDTKWYEMGSTGAPYGRSVWPLRASIFSLTASEVSVDKFTANNVHAGTCLGISSERLSATNLNFNNTTFCTLVTINASDSIKYVSDYNSINNGLLPDTYLVKEVGSANYDTVANRVDRIFFNQGAFGARLMNACHYVVDGFRAVNYASSALVADGNSSFKGSNIEIISNSDKYISNNTTAAIYSEVTRDFQLNSITIDIQDRNTIDSYTWGIYVYQGTSEYTALIDNFRIETRINSAINEMIHSVNNYGGHLKISNGNLISAGGVNGITQRLNYTDGFVDDVSIENVTVSGDAVITSRDVKRSTLKGIVSDGDVYIGNYTSGGPVEDVTIDDITCDVLSVYAVEKDFRFTNSNISNLAQGAYSRPEQISNGDFSDLTAWEKESVGGTATVSGNKVTLTNTAYYQNMVGLTVGATYSVRVFNDRAASNTNGAIAVCSGLNGSGAILGEISGMSRTAVYSFTFTATAEEHSIILYNYLSASITVYGKVSIIKEGASNVYLENVKVEPVGNVTIYGSGRCNGVIKNCSFIGGGRKTFGGFDHLLVDGNYFYSTSSAAATSSGAELGLIFKNNIVIKSKTDNEPTYNQFYQGYNYAYSTINVDNINNRS